MEEEETMEEEQEEFPYKPLVVRIETSWFKGVCLITIMLPIVLTIYSKIVCPKVAYQ
jgi:hypothetical protein